MRTYITILSVFLVVVNCQNRPPRPPPSSSPMGTPVPMPDSPPASVSPPRPKGCSPGCGSTEICAELGASYCRGGQLCSVCIKMSSIRFPASALAGMFSQQTKPAQPAVPAQPVVPQVMPQTNPLNSSMNTTLEQMSGTESTIINSTSNDTQISIIEYAAKQRNLLTGVESNSIQDKMVPSPVKETKTTLDLRKLDTKKVKYPIIVTMPDASKSLNTVTNGQNKAVKSTSNVFVDKTQDVNHMGHIDQTQMAKWYQRYQLFKAQQDQMNGNTAATNTNTDAFDYATFKKFQKWLQHNQNQAQDQSTKVQIAPTTIVKPPTPAVQPVIQPLGTVSQTVLPVVNNPAQPQIVPQFQTPTMQQQFLLWQQQQQNQANIAAVQSPMNALSGLPQTPSAVPQLTPTVLPTFGSLSQPSNPTVPQMNPAVQPAFDYAAFQKQYQQWQQSQSQKQTTTQAPPTVDYTVLQQEWLKQQQQSKGQNASNNLQIQQTSSQQIQSNTVQNPQTSQAQNTFSYVPQQPVNNFNNDPFFFNYQAPQQNTFAGNTANNDPFAVNNDPFASNNGMMDMMLLGGFGFGGGLFGF